MIDKYFYIGGNQSFTIYWLKMMVAVLLIVCLSMTGALVYMAIERRNENIVPIVINEATGDALVVDYRVIDSTGEHRAPVEIRKFTEDFLADAYTYNRFTVKSRLEALAKMAAPEALNQINNSLNLPRRSELVSRNAQGLVEIRSFMITESQPMIRVQVYFHTKVLAPSGEVFEENNMLAVMTIQVIRRSERNPHGLIVLEYRQNPFENFNQGQPPKTSESRLATETKAEFTQGK